MSEHVSNAISYNSLRHTSISYEDPGLQKMGEAKRASLGESPRGPLVAKKIDNDEKPSYKGYEEYSKANAGPDYYLGHDSSSSSSSNSCKGYAEGPLTTSLSASGEVDPNVQQHNTESEDSLLHRHDGLPRAPLPEINTVSDNSSKSTSDESGSRENNEFDHRFEPSRKSLNQSFSEPTESKTESNSGNLAWQDSASDHWDDRPPLAPMEPIKIAKVNHSWSSNRTKARSFDADSNSTHNDGLPHIPGFPAHDPGLTNPIHASVPSISEDARLARIIKDQEYTAPHHSISGGQRFQINGTNKINEFPSNMLNDTYMQPATAPSLVLVNPNSQPDIRGYAQVPQTTGSVFSFNEYTPSQLQVPFQQNSIDRNGMHENHYSKNSELGCHKVGLGNEIQDVKPGNTAYGPSGIPMRAVSNGGPLSFSSQGAHQPVNTPSYAVLLSQMPAHNALQPPQPSLTPLGASSGPASFVEPTNSSNHQQHAISQGQIPDQHSALLIPSHVYPHSKEDTIVSKKKMPIKHGVPPANEKCGEFTLRQIPPSNSHDRIYKCTHPGCDWSFARSSDQKRHIRSHQKPNLRCPYWELEPNCSRKGAMFYRLDVLKRHLRLVHLDRVADSPMGGGICKVCSHKFDSSRDFLDHCDTCAQTALAQKGKLNTV